MPDRIVLTMGCTSCKEKNYYFQRAKKKEFKLELNKFCKRCRKHTIHKEVKA